MTAILRRLPAPEFLVLVFAAAACQSSETSAPRNAAQVPSGSAAAVSPTAKTELIATTPERTVTKIPPAVAAAAAAIRSSERFQLAKATLQRIARRPPLQIAIISGSLPAGVVTIIRLQQKGPIDRYMIVSMTGLDDRVLLRAKTQALAYEMTHEDDDSPTTITVYSDGRVERASAKMGSSVVQPVELGTVADPHGRSAQLLRKLTQSPIVDVPGFGPARILVSEVGGSR